MRFYEECTQHFNFADTTCKKINLQFKVTLKLIYIGAKYS